MDNMVTPNLLLWQGAKSKTLAIANEVLFYIQEKNLEGTMIKLDFEKAFDNLSWSFLIEALSAKGFSSH